ncbi:MAG TPA: tRNA-dihydrouridine synthase family protein [Verrucomicrobiae bacterium]|nr:tRNA-dihydrouridine synthase family protein [Verrucomicrobiae bacterium]
MNPQEAIEERIAGPALAGGPGAAAKAPAELERMLQGTPPILTLAPMQDVTDLAFWRLLAGYGGADVYFTEYFRVHPTSNLDRHILQSIVQNPTGRPVIAQMIGNDIPALVRTARELQQYPIAAVDLNLGCPAPVVYRKCAGGGLLREPGKVDAILGALREAVHIKFSVKTRLGFDTPEVFSELLPIFARHSLDLLTVHGRTVKEMYRSAVHYEYIAEAVAALGCPVLANGNVYSATKAGEVLKSTGARGLMIGRGAIRNPWLFQQIRQAQRGQPLFIPTGYDALNYVRALYAAACLADMPEMAQVQRMKKYMNYFGIGVEPTGQFLHRIRRATARSEFFDICEQFLAHDRHMPLEPFRLDLHQADLLAGEHC